MDSAKVGKALIALVVFIIFVSFGDSIRYITPYLISASAGSLVTQTEYGNKLGQTVDDVVNTIHATVNGALIEHSDVLAIMCMEQNGLTKDGQLSPGNSNLKLTITSSAGAKGLTQVMPKTFEQYKQSGRGGFKNLNCKYSQIQTNPRCSIEAGARIFNDLLMRYGGDRTIAARAYNGGPGHAYGSLPNETYNYAYIKLPQCMNAIKSGRSPIQSTVWQAMIQKVSSLTNGTFKLKGDGNVVSFSTSGWKDVAANPQQRLQDIARSWINNSGLSNSPIAAFLGISQNKSGQGNQNQNSQNGGDLLSYLGKYFEKGLQSVSNSSGGGNTKQINNGVAERSRLEKILNFGDAISSANKDKPVKLPTDGVSKNNTPELLCLPSPISEGEKVIIMWACRDGAYKTTGKNFDTKDAVIGSARVSPSKNTTYSITCINKSKKNYTKANCSINISKPTIAVSISPRLVKRGDVTSITWKTSDINSCILSSNEYPNFERKGTKGYATSPAIIKDATFALTCETTTGTIKDKKVVIKVIN